MMASGKSAKKSRAKAKAPVIVRRKAVPWVTIGAATLVVALAVVIGWIVIAKQSASNDAAAAVAPFVPSATDQDPSTKITGIYANTAKYKSALHVSSTQRVNYDRYPPVGGPHDAEWAACNGVVYTKAVRDENMVHTLEHGAIWITYNPDKIAAGDLDILKSLVVGQQFISMSPYPTLDQPISLQAWGHQLKVSSASDPRVKEFITALQRNPYVYPEIGATCDQPSFDTVNPPPFDPSPRGADAIQLDGAGLTTATNELPAGATGGSGASPSSAPGSTAGTPAPATPGPGTSGPGTSTPGTSAPTTGSS